jgi:hypothetical protein
VTELSVHLEFRALIHTSSLNLSVYGPEGYQSSHGAGVDESTFLVNNHLHPFLISIDIGVQRTISSTHSALLTLPLDHSRAYISYCKTNQASSQSRAGASE